MFLIVLFFAKIATISAALSYSDDLARNKFFPLTAIAYSEQPESCLSQFFTDFEFFGKFVVKCDTTSDDTCAGFVAVSHSDQAIIISYRGTLGNNEIVQEINTTMFKPPVEIFPGGGKVNPYFSNAFNLLWKNGMKTTFLDIKTKYPDYFLWITGHSLGGSLASINAAIISNSNLFNKEKLLLITFGEPRTGDSHFVTAFDELVPNSFRVVHGYDVVNQIPPLMLFGYIHHASEVWYNNSMETGQSFVICEGHENLKCHKGLGHFSKQDHLFYFNKDVRFADNGCQKP
uniref:Fungal lipase-like domain-containing protein n=1 Tax=Panagrolaimus sp. JU765 TaxID=591449 RepID=A0AC34RB88_9BILA